MAKQPKRAGKKDLSTLLIPASTAILVALIGGIFGLATPIIIQKIEAKKADENKALVFEDLSPLVTVEPDMLDLIQSPTEGLYISKGEIDWYKRNSWSAFIDDKWYPAETTSCWINKGYPPSERRPLNLPAHDPSINVTVYWKGKGTITITSYSLIVTFSPITTTINKLSIGTGSAGGGDGPVFIQKTLAETLINPSQNKVEKEISWINLHNNMGVNFLIPLNLEKPGSYNLQVKFNLMLSTIENQATPRHLTLTTGEIEYSWVNIDDPRNYPIDAGTYNVNLVACP
jgi:hypothetical protein